MKYGEFSMFTNISNIGLICLTYLKWLELKLHEVTSQSNTYNISLKYLSYSKRLDLIDNRVQSMWTWLSAKSI
jgi:hypothetical protein